MLTAEQARKKVDHKAPARIMKRAIKRELKRIDKCVRKAARKGKTRISYRVLVPYQYIEELLRALTDLGYRTCRDYPDIDIGWEETKCK